MRRFSACINPGCCFNSIPHPAPRSLTPASPSPAPSGAGRQTRAAGHRTKHADKCLRPLKCPELTNGATHCTFWSRGQTDWEQDGGPAVCPPQEVLEGTAPCSGQLQGCWHRLLLLILTIISVLGVVYPCVKSPFIGNRVVLLLTLVPEFPLAELGAAFYLKSIK